MNRRNVFIAIVGFVVILFISYYYYQLIMYESVPGENKYRLANKYLEEGDYERALEVFEEAILMNPSYKAAFLGKGITLMQMERFDESRIAFDKALELDENFAEAYANRGILNDRTGKYEDALRDYKKALQIKPSLAEGPGWLWRFLHNVQKKPPTIADRAEYIKQELRKPKGERLLRVPEIDAQQKMYKK